MPPQTVCVAAESTCEIQLNSTETFLFIMFIVLKVIYVSSFLLTFFLKWDKRRKHQMTLVQWNNQTWKRKRESLSSAIPPHRQLLLIIMRRPFTISFLSLLWILCIVITELYFRQKNMFPTQLSFAKKKQNLWDIKFIAFIVVQLLKNN